MQLNLCVIFVLISLTKISSSQLLPNGMKMVLPIDPNDATVVEATKFPAVATPSLDWSSKMEDNILELYPFNATDDKGLAQFDQCLTQNIDNFRIEIDFEIAFGSNCSSFAFFMSDIPIEICMLT